MTSWLYLAGSLVGLWFAVQAIRPVPVPKRRSIPSFFAGWLMNELAPHHLVWQGIASAAFIAYGALGHWAGWVAVAVTLVQWAINIRLIRLSLATGDVIEEELQRALGADYQSELPPSERDWFQPDLKRLVLPFRVKDRAVERVRNRVYARVAATDLKLDIFRPRTPAPRRPVIIYVHGGGWVVGYRDRQGGPLLTELAAHGWIGVLPGYRLSPLATAPDHLVDVKRAIAWVREHADDLGADPDFIAVSGGSAGGHLAALAALTGGDTSLQPGFEQADCSVQACVPLYGVYDLLGGHGAELAALRDMAARVVVKADLDEDPARWRQFSPMAQVHGDAPPFLLVHGANDSLLPSQESRRFASKLSSTSHEPVALVELPGAQHAFDTFPSIRTAHTVLGVARFLSTLHSRGRRRSVPAAATPSLSTDRQDQS